MKRSIIKDIDVITVLSMRDDDGMTQKEIARRLGCGPAMISRILKGYPRPKKLTIPSTRDPEMDDFFAQPIPEEKPSPAPQPVPQPVRKYKTKLVTTAFEVAGTTRTFRVDLRNKTIEVRDPEDNFLFDMSLSDLHEFIDEMIDLEDALHAQTGRSAASSAADDQAIPDPR